MPYTGYFFLQSKLLYRYINLKNNKMKTLLSFILIASFNLMGISQNCGDLKTGSWKVIDDNDEKNTTYMTREDGHQIEETPAAGLKIKSKITWNSVCSYTLTTEEVLENKYGVEFPETFFNSAVICVVKEQTDDYYIAEVTIEGVIDFKMEVKYIKKG
jgi:hypothetical protein